MRLTLSSEHFEQIVRHCEGAYPSEGCGILLGRNEENQRVVVDLLLTGNAREAAAQHHRYLIPPEKLLEGELRAEQHGLEVMGYFHSHPDHPARPSETDLKDAWPNYSYLILSVQGGQVTDRRSWRLRPDRTRFDEEEILTRFVVQPPWKAI